MDSLKVKNFGPIQEANVEFGDLTILVGPQASGKSIFLQLLKLIEDRNQIALTLRQYHYAWNGSFEQNFELFFGEGMAGIWKDNTEISYNTRKISKGVFTTKVTVPEKDETIFYIPAQRILCISDGRPKPFTEFDETVPYVLKNFSDQIRLMLQQYKSDTIFPIKFRIKELIIKSINDSILHNGIIKMDSRTGQKKFRMQVSGMDIPFMTWSTGQKEFMPLILAFYWLSVSMNNIPRRDDIKYIILEEPEMGLHPQAIKSVLLQVIDLMARGYKVILSTHSPVLLEFAWAFQFLQESKVKEDALLELFALKKSATTKKLFDGIMDKVIHTYYFDRENDKVNIQDISTLDAGSENPAIAEWGGLSSFASRASEIVSKTVNLNG